MPVVASTTKRMALASSTAISTCFLISRSNTSSLCATKPPVSITLNVLPVHSATPYCRSRVTPLTLSTMALRCSSKRLKKVLFPTFGRPTIATVNPMKFLIYYSRIEASPIYFLLSAFEYLFTVPCVAHLYCIKPMGFWKSLLNLETWTDKINKLQCNFFKTPF